jgi:hypothetical protein
VAGLELVILQPPPVIGVQTDRTCRLTTSFITAEYEKEKHSPDNNNMETEKSTIIPKEEKNCHTKLYRHKESFMIFHQL